MAELTAQACRAGRALLGWGVRELAAEAGVGVATVARLEAGDRMTEATKEKIKAAFAAHKVEITMVMGRVRAC